MHYETRIYLKEGDQELFEYYNRLKAHNDERLIEAYHR